MKDAPVKAERRPVFHLIRPYFLEHGRLILIGVACLVVVDVLALLIPRIIRFAVDDVTASRTDLKGLVLYALAIAGAALVMAVFRYIWRRCLIGTSRRVEEGLRNRLFSHLQTLSPAWFDTQRTGDIMARATNDLNHIRMATGMGVVALTDTVFLGGLSLIFMAAISVRLTLFALIPMPFIALGAKALSRRMHQRYQSVQAAFSDLTESVREAMSGIRMIKAHNMGDGHGRRVRETSRAYVGENLGLVRVTGAFFPMMLLFSNLSFTAVIYLGGRLTILNTISPGEFVAFIAYLALMAWPMMALGWVTNLIQRGRASLERIDAILAEQPRIESPEKPLPFPDRPKRIAYEGITFGYGESRSKALLDISVEVRAGETLGVVGPPGAGKSTLLLLLPRLYEPETGRVAVDGADVRDFSLEDLRSRTAFMPQEPFLFAGTIRDNILFGNPEAGEKRMEEIAEKAGLSADLSSFPDGFDTVVGEKGVILSGGQKQRIALARALVADKPVLLLDDPVSQLDFSTGAAIDRTLRELSESGDRTLVIVSHRISSVRFAEKIIVLDQGRIVETGTHESLAAGQGYYARTFALQQLEEAFSAV